MTDAEKVLGKMRELFPALPYRLSTLEDGTLKLNDGYGVTAFKYKKSDEDSTWIVYANTFPCGTLSDREACLKHAKEVAGKNGLQLG